MDNGCRQDDGLLTIGNHGGSFIGTKIECDRLMSMKPSNLHDEVIRAKRAEEEFIKLLFGEENER
jgi:hypothetical protein